MWIDVPVSDGATAVHLSEISYQVVHGGLLCRGSCVCWFTVLEATDVADPD